MSEHQKVQKDIRQKPRQQTPGTPDQDEQYLQEIASRALRHGRLAPQLMTPARILHLQRTIGNAAVQRLLAEQGVNDAPHVGIDRSSELEKASSTEEDNVAETEVREHVGQGIQRRIYLNTDLADLTELYSEIPYGKKRVVLANWHWSKMDHRFQGDNKEKAKGKLIEAVNEAAKKPVALPALYNQANLIFLTKAGDREPTLYFRQGNESGRIRQQHGSGPAVVSESNKTDYFFDSEAAARLFSDYASNVHGRQKRGEKEESGKKVTLSLEAFRLRFPIYTEPAPGRYHFELTGTLDAIKKRHLSGGTIVTDLTPYTQERIESIYQSVTGQTT